MSRKFEGAITYYTDWRRIRMIKGMILGSMLLIGGMLGMNEEGKEIELFYMYDSEHGTYWLDPTAEYENVIYVDDERLEEWGIGKRDLHHGEKMVGLFDKEGWELEGMREVE